MSSSEARPGSCQGHGEAARLLKNLNLILLFFAAVSLAEPSFAAQHGDSLPCLAECESHNQVDYGPLVIQKVTGKITDERPAPAEFTPVSYCDLVRHPKEHDGKQVAVWATYRYGFEWQEMYCVKCRDEGKTWLEFEEETAPAVRHALGRAPRYQGTLNATFYGTFHGTKGPYGDGAYPFRFDVKSVEAVDLVSRAGWPPQSLSASEQQRLCQGDPPGQANSPHPEGGSIIKK